MFFIRIHVVTSTPHVHSCSRSFVIRGGGVFRLAAQPGLILSCVYACIYVCNRNVWRFDEGLASRVPYESSARTLTQSRETFTGYTVRQGLAITLEHNFMMSPAGMRNFESQIKQVCRARLRVCNAFLCT